MEDNKKQAECEKKRPSCKEQDIINAATKLFSQYGYTGTTTLTIAQEANVAEKTLFKYFHTKKELYDKAVYPVIKTLIAEKIESYTGNGLGVYSLLRDLYFEKIKLVNENPEMLKLTFHEFLMNLDFRNHMAEIWSTTYLPSIFSQIKLSEEAQKKYSSVLEGGLTRAMVCMLLAYAVDKTYIRPNADFDDEKEIEFMLELLFNGINGLKNKDKEENS